MLEGMLGEEIFKSGVSTYLKRFEFSNAETDDLWAELQKATQNTINVKKVYIYLCKKKKVKNVILT
jgi:aminopeptidase N